jgi:hypothetical protein
MVMIGPNTTRQYVFTRYRSLGQRITIRVREKVYTCVKSNSMLPNMYVLPMVYDMLCLSGHGTGTSQRWLSLDSLFSLSLHFFTLELLHQT